MYTNFPPFGTDLRKCGSDIEINLAFKRLVVHNDIILYGESEFFQYK